MAKHRKFKNFSVSVETKDSFHTVIGAKCIADVQAGSTLENTDITVTSVQGTRATLSDGSSGRLVRVAIA